MEITMTKKIKSTVDKFVESMSPKEKKTFGEEYKELLLSEMILAAMEEDNVSVRRLAKLARVSPTIIQSMRSGIKKDFKKFLFTLFKYDRMAANKIYLFFFENRGRQPCVGCSKTV